LVVLHEEADYSAGAWLLQDYLCSNQYMGSRSFVWWLQWYNSTFIRMVFFCHVDWRIVHVTLNLPPPTNITNMFGNWLMGLTKLIPNSCGNVCFMLSYLKLLKWHFFNKAISAHLAGYPQGFPSNLQVILCAPCEGVGSHKLWV
jgi:hypothetical protein